ncbi:unnamed protein product [Boreogadus saida]
MMMVGDDWVECRIDDDDDDDDDDDGHDEGKPSAGQEQMNTPPPPPEFASRANSTPPSPPSPPSSPPSPSPTPPTAPATPTPSGPVSRDPFGINKHLKVEVSDVLAEPASHRSPDRVWSLSLLGFETARVWTYRVLSLVLAVPMALLAGVFLGLLACLHIWCVVPCVQLSNTFLPCLHSVWLCAVNDFISPMCRSLALCCSQIAVSLSNYKDAAWPSAGHKEAV